MNGQQVMAAGHAGSLWDVIARYSAAVDAFLGQFLAVKRSEASRIAAEGCELLDALRRLARVGTPHMGVAWVVAGHACFAPEPPDDRLTVGGAAVTLAQAVLPAHDEVFGPETVHSVPFGVQRCLGDQVARRFLRADADRYGTPLAILAGDVAAMLAYEVLASAPVPAERLPMALRALSRLSPGVSSTNALAALLDRQPGPGRGCPIQAPGVQPDSTAIEVPLQIGAALAGAGQPQLFWIPCLAGTLATPNRYAAHEIADSIGQLEVRPEGRELLFGLARLLISRYD